MTDAAGGAMKPSSAGGLSQCARLFYERLANRRRVPRSRASSTIQVRCEGYVIDTEYTCACIDISPRGAAIESPEPIRVGTIVTLHDAEQGLHRRARVRYCLEGFETFRIGLEYTAQAAGPG